MSKAILVDTTRCIGCGLCVSACQEANGLPEKEATVLSAEALNVVEEHGGTFVRRFCMHCLEPTCASVCPVGALRKSHEGPVTYEADRCIGCRYCMLACPFGIPRYEWSSPLPRIRKCTFCLERQAQGRQPACTEVCPVEASIFGDRDELLEEAKKRIAENSDGYIPRIYGSEEAGGTSVLYLSAVPFESLGFPEGLGQEPLPMLTYRALSKIPSLVMFGGLTLGGIWWITNRRVEVAEADHQKGEREKIPEGKGDEETEIT